MFVSQTKKAFYDTAVQNQNDGWTIEVEHGGKTYTVDCLAFDGAKIYAFVSVQADAATGAARWGRLDVTDCVLWRSAREKIEVDPAAIPSETEVVADALAAVKAAQ
ncbi:MAG: hypothetical protein IKU86_12245 [Thermoguttaceae bacterium]|nr:hypothetical protein [Thermoguttaceae bacterium]